MIQDILTYITVAGAIAYTAISFWRTLFSSNKKASCSGGCSSGCDAKRELMHAINHRKR